MKSIYSLLIIGLMSIPLTLIAQDTECHKEQGCGVEFNQLLFLEKPVPCQSVTANHLYTNTEHGNQHKLILTGSYEFFPQFGLEVALPYLIESHDDESESRFGDLHLALKAAHFAMEKFAFGYGLGFGIPLEEGGHHGNSVHLEPYFSFGFSSEGIQTGALISFEIPTGSDHVENAVSYAGFALFQVSPYVHLIGELKGVSVLNGNEKGEATFDISGGCRIYPLGNEKINFGVGLKLPVDNEAYDFATLISFMYHY